MKYRNLIFSEYPVKLFDYTVKIIYNVVTCIVCMAGIKTDTQTFRMTDSVINRSEFFKGFSDFGTFSCHRFQCDIASFGFCQHFI